ncbi:RNA polymerase sigma factor [Halioxenophilus sp. WMMB6]|uniref:RNA polymerase sigma factor n=1 Tax=Halioxenophilus sp. WMMB6 TaxID=3073815 RepID=UPI00295EA183|nr:RNA polymerase sigma factor [Halioxenophilus sp. WMMB6]
MNNNHNSERGGNERVPAPSDEPKSMAARYRVLDVFMQQQAPLRRFISRFLVPAQDIEDIAQEAFLRAYETEKKRALDEPKAFLFRIARNLMLSELGKKSRKVTDYIDDIESVDTQLRTQPLEECVASQQKVGILCEAVATLPPRCRKVFLLKKVYGMPHKEISEQLGISVSTIEKHLIKGMRQCNAILQERYGNDLQVQDSQINIAKPKGSPGASPAASASSREG